MARPEAVAHLGLRTRSPVAADALALATTSGRLSASALARLLVPEPPDAEPLGPPGDVSLQDVVTAPEVLAGLALLWCGLGDATGLRAGATAYRRLLETGATASLHPVHHQATGQAFALAGWRSLLRDVLPKLTKLSDDVRHYLEADLAHPWADPTADPDVDRWTALLSARFVEHGLAPLRLRTGHAHLFDDLTADVTPAVVHGPLVTVVVPCYRPDVGLLSSVASIAAQTWADLEVVVVDDASGPDYADLVEEAARLDPRVRVLRLDRNGGSYLARRAALEMSTGTLVTTQDADDWSHPERLECQVSLLQERPEAVASRSQAVRAKDDLTHQWFGYSPLRPNASSLLVRRDALTAHGTFLPVRKSADSELTERLERFAGPVLDSPAPMAVTRLREGSLSRGDFGYQWSHPDRLAFRGTYRAWHRTLLAEGRSPAGAALPEVPPSFTRGIAQVAQPPASLPVCLLGDFGDPPTDDTGASTVRRAGVDRLGGRAVGLWHAERPRAATRARREMHDGWYDVAVRAEGVHLVTRTLACRVGTLLVLDPTVLLLATAQPCRVEADTVEVVLDRSALGTGPSGLPPDLLGVADACLEWFGRRPVWRCGPDADDAALRSALPGLPVLPWDGWDRS